MSIPQDLMTQAATIGAGMDQLEQQGMQMGAPQGKYSARAMNALVDVVNEMMMQMGEATPYPEFTEDQTMFPQDFMQMLMSIMTIAEQAGVPVEMSLSEVVSDRDVAKLVALLKRVAKDKRMQDFLSREEEPEEMEVTEEIAETPAGDMAMSDEELFTSRMR